MECYIGVQAGDAVAHWRTLSSRQHVLRNEILRSFEDLIKNELRNARRRARYKVRQTTLAVLV